MAELDLRAYIRDVPDFPKPGIIFRDITPLLQSAPALGATLDALEARAAARQPDVIVGIESRGFLFGVPLAARLGLGFVPIRKPGKLPAETHRETYTLEYGEDAVEIHADALEQGQRVLIVDDLLATGGTAAASTRLVERMGASVVGLLFLIELGFLEGRQRLPDRPVDTLITFGPDD
jgi:adenine phosphoribosyltransferase